MNHILERLKKIDKKYLIIGGVAVAIALILVLTLVFGASPESGKENNNHSAQNETEQSGLTNDSEKDDLDNGQSGESENQESESVGTENLDSENVSSENAGSENQDTNNQDSNHSGDNNTSSESDESDNQNNNQSTTGNGNTSAKPQNKPSTGNNNSESSSETTGNPTTKPEENPSTPSTPDEEEPTKPDDSGENLGKETYTINVFTSGGYQMYNVKANIYKDSNLSELVTTVSTNNTGRATVQLESGKKYRITLSNLPEGYKVKESYSFSGKTALIVLESSVITGKPLPDRVLKEGDVMYDFTVPSVKGGNIRLSELVKTKDLVVLNFWFVNCSFCVKEFPMLEKAYLKYKDKAEVVALTPFDTVDSVKEFLAEKPLQFQVATCDISIPNLFNVQAYPVTVYIDKYGVIREIKRGALLEEDGFVSTFDKYL